MTTLIALPDLLARLQTLLMDTDSRIWDEATLTEALRLALGEYNLAAPIPVTLTGLDEAALTTLPDRHASLLVLGAAGYAAAARGLDRAEGFEFEQEARDLQAWSAARLSDFRALLAIVYPTYAAPGSPSGGSDPALLAAQVQQLTAQAALQNAQAAAQTGQEARAQSATDQSRQDRLEEAQRIAALHTALTVPWSPWPTPDLDL